MKKILLSLMLILAFGALNAKDYHRTLGQFNKISVVDSISVVYRCIQDSTGSAAFSSDPDIADAIMLQIDKGELKIRISTEAVGSSRLPVLYLYSDFMQHVYNSSNATVTIDNPAPVPTFKAVQVGNGTINTKGLKATTVEGKIQTGNGTITFEGTCDLAKFNMLGAGAIQADLLKAEKVECKSVGSGTVGCWPEYSLKINCLGSTKFYYKGEPTIRKKGGGKLIPID